jgi:hypothetical protein
MPETDTEDRFFPNQLPDIPDGILDGCGIAWSIRQENAVWLHAEDVFGRSFRRNNGDLCTTAREVSQDVGLDAKVVSDNVERAWLHSGQSGKFDEIDRGVRVFVSLVDGHGCGKVGTKHLRSLFHLLQQRGFVMINERDDAAHRTLETNVPHERTRVDVGEHGNAVLREVHLQTVGRPPVTRERRKPLDDKRFKKRLPRFDIFRIDAGVANP